MNCKECGNKINSNDKICSNCGCPVENNINTIICEECKKEIDITNKECPNCGCPINNQNSNIKINNKKGNLNKYIVLIKNNKIPFIIAFSILIVVIIIILICSKETTLYRFSNDYSSYESITLKNFGKCYYYYSHNDESKTDNICSYKKIDTSYVITISDKTLYCNKKNNTYKCEFDGITITYKID